MRGRCPKDSSDISAHKTIRESPIGVTRRPNRLTHRPQGVKAILSNAGQTRQTFFCAVRFAANNYYRELTVLAKSRRATGNVSHKRTV
jgi:hypothetical protein